VAAGTGAVAFALGATGTALVDGWGNLLGDAGSGYWIGRAGLDAALRAHDGRGPATALTPLVEHDFPDIESAYLLVQNDPGYVNRIAAYARMIAGLADTDAVCAAIVDQAAEELATSAIAALRRVGQDEADHTLVSVQGKIFWNQRLKAHFEQLVHAAVPGAEAVAPQGDGLDGAGQLFDLPDDSPLRACVRYA
jgi:N-acetylglucosamine kinase-like BadF-type ATPase